jgi:hypothetical protein
VQTVIAVNHDVRIGSPKTAKGRRTVVLDSGTVAALREHRQRQLAERLLTVLPNVHPAGRASRPAADPAARPAAHVGDARTVRRCASRVAVTTIAA